MRLPTLAGFAAALVLTGCLEESPLQDTLMFPPGLDIQYHGQAAKLYGTSQCAQGALTGHTCLIFVPHRTEAQGVIINGQHALQVQLTVRKDPSNPVYYLVEDQFGALVVSTTGRHDEYGNIDIRPVELSN